MMTTIAILNNNFINAIPKLLEIMGSGTPTFLFSDRNPLVARFFSLRGYRKCIVYHPGVKPKHSIGKYQTKGGYASYQEIYITMQDEADSVC